MTSSAYQRLTDLLNQLNGKYKASWHPYKGVTIQRPPLNSVLGISSIFFLYGALILCRLIGSLKDDLFYGLSVVLLLGLLLSVVGLLKAVTSSTVIHEKYYIENTLGRGGMEQQKRMASEFSCISYHIAESVMDDGQHMYRAWIIAMVEPENGKYLPHGILSFTGGLRSKVALYAKDIMLILSEIWEVPVQQMPSNINNRDPFIFMLAHYLEDIEDDRQTM